MRNDEIATESLLARWPRERPDLPAEYVAVYAEHMQRNRGGGSSLNRAALLAESWMHRQVARRQGRSVLELGAGGLTHVRMERADTYDVVEPLTELVEGHTDVVSGRVVHLGDYSDLVALAAVSSPRYDKVVSVAVLEHLEDLPAVVAASAALLHPGGAFEAGIPAEGGWLWGAAQRWTTGASFRRRYGLDYATLMAWEHINDADEIIAVVRALFRDVRVRRFPTPLRQGSLYVSIEGMDPRLDVVRTILDDRQDDSA